MIFRHRVACEQFWKLKLFFIVIKVTNVTKLRSFNLKAPANRQHIKNPVNLMTELQI